MTKAAVADPEERDFIISSLSPSRVQKRLAFAVVLVLLGAFFIIAGFLSAFQLPRVTAFVPIYATAMFVNDAITAVLLFAQFSILRSRALLAIATGYLFTAFISVPWLLTFPAVFAPNGLLGAGLQSTAWLYIVWHAGFPTFVITFALLKDGDPSKRLWQSSARVAILASVAITASIVCAVTFLITSGDQRLPPLMSDAIHLSPLWPYAAGFASLLSLLALMVLWVRRRSVLDLWLMVVMCAYVIEMCLISFPVPARYSVGWYGGRSFGFLSGSLVLFVLLYETTTLYARLFRALLAQRRERQARLMTGDAVSTSIAHEVKQPLAAMITNASTGFRWLDRATPDVDEAKAAFQQIMATGHRAGKMIESIRGIFKKDARTRTSLDINELVREALTLTRGELQTHRISVQIESNEQLPRVSGDPVQLEQVLLNLITNAIDSMATTSGPRLLCVRSNVHESGAVMVSVEDTGVGVEAKHIDQIFNPLFTTKTHGMGMGLSICRSIIEAHEGQLWVTPNRSQGAVFQFTLPAATVASAGHRQESSSATSRATSLGSRG